MGKVLVVDGVEEELLGPSFRRLVLIVVGTVDVVLAELAIALIGGLVRQQGRAGARISGGNVGALVALG